MSNFTLHDSPKTTDTTAHRHIGRSQRRALLHELSPATHALHVQVLRSTLSEGVPVNPVALLMVLSAHEDLVEVPLRFTADHVNELLWFAVAEYCDDLDLDMPSGCSEALHAILAIGTACEALDAGSDTPAQLFAAFRELSGG